MLLTAILGGLAGFAAPQAEPYVKQGMDGLMLSDVKLSPADLRGLSFAACLLAAAILAAIFGSGNGIALALGAALGAFGPKIYADYKARQAPDYDE